MKQSRPMTRILSPYETHDKEKVTEKIAEHQAKILPSQEYTLREKYKLVRTLIDNMIEMER